jgi:hypothetical protein
MPRLHLHFQEGFRGDDVVIRVDGEECLRLAGLQSKPAHGYADLKNSVEVAEGAHAVEISIPSRQIEKRIDVDAKGDLYIGIGLGPDEARVRIRHDAPGYG